MGLVRSILRIFSSGDGGRVKPGPPSPGPGGGGGSSRSGNRFASTLTNTISAVVTLAAAGTLWSWIQNSRRYAFDLRLPDPYELAWDGVPFECDHWCGVLAAGFTASWVSLVQLGLLTVLIFISIRMVLRMLGDIGASRPVGARRHVAAYALLCMSLMPMLGMLSTCMGILGTDEMPRKVVKLVIFGPSAIGVSGLMLATFVRYAALRGEE